MPGSTQGSYLSGIPGMAARSNWPLAFLARRAGLQQLLEVPYKGSSQAHPDLISGRLSAMIDPVSAVATHIKSGAVRALAVTTSSRVAAFPDVPTVAESGVAGFEISSWGGVFAPAGTPKDVVQRIHQALRKTLEAPDTVKKFSDWGLVAKASTPAEFDSFVKAEVARWRAVMLAPKT